MKTIAVLDDYQNVALNHGAWDKLKGRAQIKQFNRHIGNEAELAAALADANVIVCNRERTKITKSLLEKLPKLELIVTFGMRNASIDVAADSVSVTVTIVDDGRTVTGAGTVRAERAP